MRFASHANLISVVLLLPLTMLVSPRANAGDAVQGEDVFKQCAACHRIGPGAKHGFGPALNNIVGGKIAASDGYDYSEALKKFSVNSSDWTDHQLDEFLKAPMSVVVGTKMAYPGLADDTARADVIAYMQKAGSDAQEIPTVASIVVVKERTTAANAVIPAHGVLHLGRIAVAEEVEAWNIDVRPDGQGLPVGAGSAIDGAELYDAQCASCHGAFGEGEGRWPILAGGFGTLADDRPEKTIGSYWPYLSTVYDYVNRAMPFGNARSLSSDEVYAITAYLLYLNDQVDEDFELSNENFSSIQLPNEENFFMDNRSQEPEFAVDGEPCMSYCIEGTAKVTQRARILDVTPDSEHDSGISVK